VSSDRSPPTADEAWDRATQPGAFDRLAIVIAIAVLAFLIWTVVAMTQIDIPSPWELLPA
jgi:hypothetical protein